MITPDFCSLYQADLIVEAVVPNLRKLQASPPGAVSDYAGDFPLILKELEKRIAWKDLYSVLSNIDDTHDHSAIAAELEHHAYAHMSPAQRAAGGGYGWDDVPIMTLAADIHRVLHEWRAGKPSSRFDSVVTRLVEMSEELRASITFYKANAQN